jgi:hypothetical protein
MINKINKYNLEHLYKNIADGCVLAFYHNEWYYQIIPFFTRERKNELVPHHCGIVYEVKREENGVSFMFSEQTFVGGRYKKVSITKIKDNYFTTDKYFRRQNLITLHEILMSQEHISRGIADAKQQVGKKYGYGNLIFGAEFIEKILPKKFFKWLDKKEGKRVCSTHVAYNLKKAGFMLPKGDFLSPLEITKLNIYS